jgi:hypothetical protein
MGVMQLGQVVVVAYRITSRCTSTRTRARKHGVELAPEGLIAERINERIETGIGVANPGKPQHQPHGYTRFTHAYMGRKIK